MTDNAPDRIWAKPEHPDENGYGGFWIKAKVAPSVEYIRLDLYTAVCAERDALKARAEKAEAQLERVKEMRDQIVGDKINLRGELATMRVEVKRLRAALFECQEEIDDYIQHEYPHDHPVQERYRQRDYAANPARIALQEKSHD